MIGRTIRILTSHTAPYKTCVMGNEGIARAALEAGVNGVFAYPGTPSTEISEIFNHINNFQNIPINKEKYPDLTLDSVYFEYSINEKIALEKAIAYSIGSRSALCVMKNVGMNVACDALMSVTYQSIAAPLVIIVCDDPGCHSSSNEQDSRYWGPMASVPVFNPATPKEAFEMVKLAFLLSGEIRLPVIVRTTTRVSHTRGVLNYGIMGPRNRDAVFDRLPEYINIPARTATAHTKLLGKLKSDAVLALLDSRSKLMLNNKNAKLGIISSGVATTYALEILHGNQYADKIDLLDLGLIHPFPEEAVKTFLAKGYEKILVLEELDAFVETATRTIAQRYNLDVAIYGKGFSGLVSTGEFSIDLLTSVFEDFAFTSFLKNTPLAGINTFLDKLPQRPPVLCAGCPHRATFYLLKLAIPRDQSELIMCGDIGCFGLGALPPLKMIDTINHMGMSISMAQGLYESFHDAGKSKKVVALLGDGTFFHSGLSSLVNAIYTKANILVIIFDNRTVGMTGHQSHPGAPQNTKYHEIDIPKLLNGLGVEVAETFDPFNIPESYQKVSRAMEHTGVSVLVSRAPCIFLSASKSGKGKKNKIIVDPNLCNTCGNHLDHSLTCSRCYAPKNNLSRAKAKLMSGVSIPGNEELCPANICNHGFFNSILEGDYKVAVEIIRDKMLFARTCGDICHRPCELFSNETNIVPIKKLKKFVSAIDENFYDFSIPINRVWKAKSQDKSIAIIGAGPAGLSAAYDLVQNGYEVLVYEKGAKAGGMVGNAIPSFRMDKSSFEYEIAQLRLMGVRFHFNTELGKAITLDQLSCLNSAVLLAIGLNKAKTLSVVENNLPPNKKIDAISFLQTFNEGKKIIEDGSVVLVIGGGNSAIDAARAAKKLCPDNNIIVSCIETADAMPAFAEEVVHAQSEGINFINDSYLEDCSYDGGKIMVTLNGFDSKTLLHQFGCNCVITAIGQTTDAEAIAKLQKDESTRVLNDNCHTGYKNVFVAGDISSGNSMSVIGAIASGKKAVVAIRKLLEGYAFAYEGEKALERLNTNPTPLQKLPSSDLEAGEIPDIGEYNLFQSCQKCNHCIDNFGCPAMVKVNGKVTIDESRCTQCGLCIDVCPNNAIRWETIPDEELIPLDVI